MGGFNVTRAVAARLGGKPFQPKPPIHVYDLKAHDLTVAKDVARAALPEGITESKRARTFTGSTHAGHRHVALACRDVMASRLPGV
jgi:hypothetical protein